MAGFWRNYTVYIVASLAVFYTWILSPILWTTLGVGRKWEPLQNFNYTCSKIQVPGLEACEDMWLHEPSGLLYMACGSTRARMGWLPSIDALNTTARDGRDRIAILDTRASGPVEKRLKWTTTIGYTDAEGGKDLDLHGIDVHVGPGDDPMLKILINNHRPYVDPVTLKPLDATKLGANSTIEVFSAKLGDTVLRHVKTWADETIATPNRVQWIGNGAFVWSNDKSSKTGLRRTLDPLLGGGSIGFCSSEGCKIAYEGGLNYPNGLVRGHDNHIYVPSSITGKIFVMALQPDNTLVKIHTIQLEYPIDNMSIDSNGDIYAATFPELYNFIFHHQSPYEVHPPAAVWRIRKVKEGNAAGEGLEFEVVKVLEGSGETLPSATVAVHDPKTGRMFLGGAVADYISICEKIKR